MLKKNKFCWVMLIIVLLSGGISQAASKDEIITGEYSLTAIGQHTPLLSTEADDYWNAMQRVELKFDGLEKYRNLPKLVMKQPYIGEITLGPTQQKFAIIIDVTPDEKRLYLDTDGDGDFSGEPMTLLLNEWYGLQVYLVIGPEPLEVKVHTGRGEEILPMQISIASGLLNKPRVLVEETPFLYIKVKTWFLGYLKRASGREMAIAMVDADNNGKYDDKGDCVFLDYNHNLVFEAEEAVECKKKATTKTKLGTLKLNWQTLPRSLKVGDVK